MAKHVEALKNKPAQTNTENSTQRVKPCLEVTTINNPTRPGIVYAMPRRHKKQTRNNTVCFGSRNFCVLIGIFLKSMSERSLLSKDECLTSNINKVMVMNVINNNPLISSV